MAAMIRNVRQVKAANIVAGLMGSLKVRHFCILAPAPTLTAASALSPIPAAAAAAAADADQGRVSAAIGSFQEEEAVARFKRLEEEVATRRKRKRGGGRQVHQAPESKLIKELAMFGLDQINQREHTNLVLVRVLGAWYKIGPGQKHDITLEATDGGGRRKFYRVRVTDLCMFKRFGYTKLELVQWELLDDPYPIMFFKPETYKEYTDNLRARLESLRETPRSCRNPNPLRYTWVALNRSTIRTIKGVEEFGVITPKKIAKIISVGLHSKVGTSTILGACGTTKLLTSKAPRCGSIEHGRKLQGVKHE